MGAQDPPSTYWLATKITIQCRQLFRRLTAFYPFIDRGKVVSAVRPRTDRTMRDARADKQPYILVRGWIEVENTLVILNGSVCRHAPVHPAIVDDQLTAASAEGGQVGVIGIQGWRDTGRLLAEVRKVVASITPVRIVVEKEAKYSGRKTHAPLGMAGAENSSLSAPSW